MKFAEKNVGGWDNLAFYIGTKMFAQVCRREVIRRDGKQWYFELTGGIGHVSRSYYPDPLAAMEAAEEAIVDCLLDLKDIADLASRQSKEPRE